MNMILFAGDYAYSSWSLRGWLLLDAFGIPFRLRYAHMRTQKFTDLQEAMSPSRTVPALQVDAGDVDGGDDASFIAWDSLAIAETVAELFPDARLWPTDPAHRAIARSIAAEMHAGFQALRSACPMNMRRAYEGFAVSEEVRADLVRLSTLWAHARAQGGSGPFLFGAFSAVDAFFAPIASRIATYDLPVEGADAAYVAALLGHPSVRRWRAMGMADGHVQPQYEMDLPARPNPHEPAVTGVHVEDIAAENPACPYSGKPVAPDSIMQVGDRVIGYCNTFCRAKSAADPLAWPPTAALLAAQSG